MPRDMSDSWTVVDTQSLADEAALLRGLIKDAGLDASARARITAAGADYVRRIRASVERPRQPAHEPTPSIRVTATIAQLSQRQTGMSRPGPLSLTDARRAPSHLGACTST